MRVPGKRAEDIETRRTEIALFRYGLLAPILHRELVRGELLAYLRHVAGSRHQIPYSSQTTVSFTTLWRWLVAYRREGFDGLRPRPRRDEGTPRRVPQEVIERAILLRREVPSRSASTIVHILARDGSLPRVKESTLRHLLSARGYGRGQGGEMPQPIKRFEWDRVNALWQGDALVGPWLPDPERPGRMRRAHLFAFLDDHSRLVPYAEWFWEEALPRMERVLRLERGRHLAVAGLSPAPLTTAQQAKLDFLAVLRAEYQQLLRQELGHIPFAKAISDSTKPEPEE